MYNLINSFMPLKIYAGVSQFPSLLNIHSTDEIAPKMIAFFSYFTVNAGIFIWEFLILRKTYIYTMYGYPSRPYTTM